MIIFSNIKREIDRSFSKHKIEKQIARRTIFSLTQKNETKNRSCKKISLS